MKRPSFQFYPSDWLNNSKLRLATWEAKGLWIDLLCYMHNDYHYGYLCVGEKYLRENEIKRLLNANTKRFNRVFIELKTLDIIVDDELGFYSPRMVRDEYIRKVRAESGAKGGNPNLVNQNPKQNPTPSSSSSSSVLNPNGFRERSAKAPKQPSGPRAKRLPADWQPSEKLLEWAKGERNDLNIALEVEKFRDYWHSASRNATKLDWDKAFKNWIRNAHGQSWGRTNPQMSQRSATQVSVAKGHEVYGSTNFA